MKATARVRANRRNAKLSTGPKSQAGKARTARNALRHGLAVPISALPVLDAAVERLAQRLAGPRPPEDHLENARQLAEAQVDISRVRRARAELFSAATAAFADIESGKPATPIAAAMMARSPPAFQPRPGTLLASLLDQERPDPDNDADSVEAIIGDLSKNLNRLDRYERRAMSRRKFAVRAFDAGAPSTLVDEPGHQNQEFATPPPV